MGIWLKQGVVIPPNTTDLNGGSSFSGTSNGSALYEGNPQLISANPDGNVFKMWFAGANNTYYAESNDGISWTRRATALVTGSGLPRIFKNNGTYYLYVTNSPALSITSVWTSSDGVNFTQQNANALTRGGAGAWDVSAIYYLQPAFKDSNGTWHATYSGDNAVTAAMGVATSTDLINWTKFGGNPVATNPAIYAAEVHSIGGIFYGWGSRTIAGFVFPDPADLVRAQSTDLITWTNQIISVQRSQPYEGPNIPGGELAAPSLVEANGKTYMFYTATTTGPSGTGYQLCLAIATAPLSYISGLTAEGDATPGFVQAPAPSAFASNTQFSKAFAMDNVAGDTLVCELYSSSAITAPTISDTQGNVWVRAFVPQVFPTGASLTVWYALNCKSGPNTVTVQLNGSATSSCIITAEYCGCPAFDGVVVNSGSGTILNSGSFNTTVARDTLIGFYANFNGSIGGTGTLRATEVNTFSLFDTFVNALGSYAATGTGTTGGWAASLLALSFVAPPVILPVYSVPDCRTVKPNAASNRSVNSTLICDVQTSSNPAISPVDSRVSKPVASGSYPQNSRTPGTYGPGVN